MDKVFKKLLGKHLRKRRKEFKWTYARLADETNLDEDHIGKIERGVKEPFTSTLFKLAIALDLDVNQVFKDIQQEYNPSDDL